MKFIETPLKGAFVIALEKREDHRGFFARSWCKNELEAHGLSTNIAQANTSYSEKKGTLRGMHYQVDPYQETKLIRCVKGSFYDVIIDLRKDSNTYGQHFGIELSESNYKMLYVPKDFAHGFLTLEDHTVAFYMVTEFYAPGAEAGIRYNDPAFNIKWPIEPIVLTDKDLEHADYKL